MKNRERNVSVRGLRNAFVCLAVLGVLQGCAVSGGSPEQVLADWAQAEGSAQEKVLFIRRNVTTDALRKPGAYPFRLGVAVPFNRPNEHGLPDVDEARQLDEIEANLVAALSEAKAVHVLVLTSNGMREFVFYTAAPEAARAIVEKQQAAEPGHRMRYLLSEDPQWSLYQSFKG